MGTALITGASAGLGVEFARLFARDRHDVVLIARREDRLKALAQELEALGIRAQVVALDLSQPHAPHDIFKALTGTPIEFLVNNAGFGSGGMFAKLSLARELQMIDLNIRSLVELTHLFLPSMLQRGSGRILNVGSVAGFQPGPFMATYYASKAFVNSFSEALHDELLGTGVTCTVLAPGATSTEFAEVAKRKKSPLFAKAPQATAAAVAEEGYQAMMRGQAMIVTGTLNKIMIQSQRLAPRAIVRKLAAQMNRGD